MKYQRFSPRQTLTLTWWKRPEFADYDGILCDGSIRSGKTVSMAVGFILWSMYSFNNESFAICGRTIESLRRNVIVHLPSWLEGLFKVTERRAENKLIISVGGHSNTYYLFGGRDESSYTLVQGMTLAGVLFDEVALMPRSFVEQALARCSVAGSKFWFNCNPEGPMHWFYKEWVLECKRRNVLHLHFTMADNLSLSEKIKQRYEGMYTGVFYARYILGKWTKAEGLVYPFFDAKKRMIDDDLSSGRYYITAIHGKGDERDERSYLHAQPEKTYHIRRVQSTSRGLAEELRAEHYRQVPRRAFGSCRAYGCERRCGRRLPEQERLFLQARFSAYEGRPREIPRGLWYQHECADKKK